MFTNIETGKRIEDRDYRRFLRIRKLEADRAAKAAAEKEAALEEREEVAERVEELGEAPHYIDAEPFSAWLDNIHGCGVSDLAGTVSLATLAAMLGAFTESYAGEWGSEEEYTQDAVDQGIFGEVGQGTLSNYVDVQSLSRDLFMSDMYSLEAPHYRIFAFFNV